MRIFLIITLLGLMSWSCGSTATDGVAGAWNATQTGVDVKLTGIFFVNNSTGWAVGDNFILSTDNGGKTWNKQFYDFQSNFTSVSFIDAQNGWVAGAGGKILKTVDGGQNWKDISVDAHKSFHDIHFADSKKGWAVGYNDLPSGALLSTTDDGGTTWVNQIFVNSSHTYLDMQQAYSMNRVFALDNKRIWASGNGRWFVTSETGGSPWTDLSDLTPLGEHRSIFFHDKLNGWMLSPPGKIFQTLDGGKTWRMVYQAIFDLYSIYFSDPQHGYAVGENNIIVKTKDSGKTWVKDDIVLEYTANLNQVFFTDSVHGWIAGNNGILLRYWK